MNRLDKKILFCDLEDKSIKPKQGFFYNGQVFDAYNFVTDLIWDAKESKDLGKKWFAFSRFDIGCFWFLERLR